MGVRRVVLLVVLVFLTAGLGVAQEQSAGGEPEPYTPDEFPSWARDLRRGEIIALGSFPLVLLLSNVGYDVVRFGRESLRAGEWNYTYAPWFFGPPDKPPLSEDERIGVILTAAGISVSVAIVDFIIGRIRDGNNANSGRTEASGS